MPRSDRSMLRLLLLMACTALTLPARAQAPASWTLGTCQNDPLIEAWKQTVERGCQVKMREGMLPLTARLLRNVPFALRGHPFKSPDLRAFFATRKGGCDAPWYQAGTKTVKLPPGAELRCARRLKTVETALREKAPLPAAADTFLLQNLPGELIHEMLRLRGESTPGNTASLEKNASGWKIIFNRRGETTEDEPPDESSMVIRCDAKGESCQVFFAG